ncbi:MAG: exosortase/archaeosortase family protein [Acidimicrobiia bacterium]|nr:exosortase/archaeosortase family protein [Acidimicrobiia bacterium]MBP8182237.1 exosortase/archaeosortase family protein [Acidimicrobiia bacterium]
MASVLVGEGVRPARSRMSPVVVTVLSALFGLVVGVGAFYLLADLDREVETRLAGGIVQALTDAHLYINPTTKTVAILPADGAPFRAIITLSCSAAAPLAVALGLAVSRLGRGSSRRILTALLVGSAVLFFVNLARMTATILVGVYRGLDSMAAFHDVGGVPLSMLSVGLACGVATRILLKGRPGAASDPQPALIGGDIAE